LPRRRRRSVSEVKQTRSYGLIPVGAEISQKEVLYPNESPETKRSVINLHRLMINKGNLILLEHCIVYNLDIVDENYEWHLKMKKKRFGE